MGDNEDISRDWKKLVRTAEKSGLRDGIDAGRQSVFQESFDEGYKEGFKTGFAAGLYKGALIANGIQKTFPEGDVLAKTRQGWCTICKDEDLLKKPVKELPEIQRTHSNNLLKELHSKYSSLIKEDLPSEI